MNTKTIVVGALAVIGGIVAFTYLTRPRRNSEGFFGIDGRQPATVSQSGTNLCAQRQEDGSVKYVSSQGTRCPKGFTRVRFFGDREGV